MNNNNKVISIFPTPVYFSTLERELTKKECSFLDRRKLDVHKGEGNTTSNDNYILNNQEFKNLKKELQSKVQDYFDNVISPANNVTPYITQSWLNYTETNQYHHRHGHSNSIISGVFYINCNEEFDKIKFFKDDDYKSIFIEKKNWNSYNSDTWWFSVKTGDIILFPSSLTHSVETKQGNNTRISLAFNVFIKGTIGDNVQLTELKL
jgi:uncharacterized protein (TIGR02466 family)